MSHDAHGCDTPNEVTERRGEILLGKAASGCGVWYWPHYGVVCPCIVTTNGNLRTLMRSWARPASLTPEGCAFFVGCAVYAMSRIA